MRLLFEVGVVLLQASCGRRELVEAGGLDQHAGVGAREAGDSERADDSDGDEYVSVVQRHGNLSNSATFIAADQDDVILLLQMETLRGQTEYLGPGLAAAPGRGAESSRE